MKKILLVLLAMFSVTLCYSKTTWYKSISFSMATVDSNGTYHWGKDEDSSVSICIDTDEDLIVIYSPTIQTYRVLKAYDVYTDYKGGQQLKFDVVDQDRDLGSIRLRVDKNGNKQLYVDFSNIAWMYNLK